MNRLLAALALLASLSVSCKTGDTGELKMNVQRIWESEKHCAFTSIVQYKGLYYVAFREADRHVFDYDDVARGRIRILVSKDGESWTSAACLTRQGFDLRDPSLSVTPDGRLLVSTGGSVYNADKLLERRAPMYSFSTDGKHFSEPEEIGVKSSLLSGKDWLWKVDWNGDTGYGVVYSDFGTDSPGYGTNTRAFLVKTKDGIHYEEVVAFDVDGRPNEAAVHFLPDGRMLMLLRREADDGQGVFGISEAPYTDWKLQKTGIRFGGPNFIVTGEDSFIAGTRMHYLPGSCKTVLVKGTSEGLKEEVCILPSGGDTSYPGFLIVGDELWVSYYSTHETPKAAVYLAKIPLSMFEKKTDNK